MQRKYIVVIILVIVISSVIILPWVFRPSTMSKVGPGELWQDQYITNLQWDGYRHFCATNQSHLFIYDYYDSNMSNIIEIPGSAINSIHSLVVRPFSNLYVLSNDDIIYSFQKEQTSLIEPNFIGLNYSAGLEFLETDVRGDNLFIGTVHNGLYAYEFATASWFYLTTQSGLYSNHVETICVEGSNLILESGGGLQLYDLSTDTLTNLTRDYDFDIRFMIYSSEYSELYLGTNAGVHIYRLVDNELTYVRALGPSDGLQSASITGLDLDLTSHKLMISTGQGICTFDLHTHDVTQLDNTEDASIGVPLDSFHFYSGSKCNIVFATTRTGVWVERLDYAAPAPFDISSSLTTILGVFLGFGFSLGTIEYQRYRKKQDDKGEEEKKRIQCLREIRSTIHSALQYLLDWAQPNTTLDLSLEEKRKAIHSDLLLHTKECGDLIESLQNFTDKMRIEDTTVIGKDDPRIVDALELLHLIDSTLDELYG